MTSATIVWSLQGHYPDSNISKTQNSGLSYLVLCMLCTSLVSGIIISMYLSIKLKFTMTQSYHTVKTVTVKRVTSTVNEWILVCIPLYTAPQLHLWSLILSIQFEIFEIFLFIFQHCVNGCDTFKNMVSHTDVIHWIVLKFYSIPLARVKYKLWLYIFLYRHSYGLCQNMINVISCVYGQ